MNRHSLKRIRRCCSGRWMPFALHGDQADSRFEACGHHQSPGQGEDLSPRRRTHFQPAEVERHARAVTRPLLAFEGILSGTVMPALRMTYEAILLDTLSPLSSTLWRVRLVNVSHTPLSFKLGGEFKSEWTASVQGFRQFARIENRTLLPSETGFFQMKIE